MGEESFIKEIERYGIKCFRELKYNGIQNCFQDLLIRRFGNVYGSKLLEKQFEIDSKC